MYDVGGQRNERKKWIHCFEGISVKCFFVYKTHTHIHIRTHNNYDFFCHNFHRHLVLESIIKPSSQYVFFLNVFVTTTWLLYLMSYITLFDFNFFILQSYSMTKHSICFFFIIIYFITSYCIILYYI